MYKPKKVILIPFTKADGDNNLRFEAKFFYQEYFQDAEELQIVGNGLTGKLFIKDELAMYIIGEGKVSCAMTTSALLCNSDFDFSDTIFILCGCCGSAYGKGVPGDVYVVEDTVDIDLGYRIDSRDNNNGKTWYPNPALDDTAHVELNKKLANDVYELIKDEPVSNNDFVDRLMKESFNNEGWATRKPEILKATSVTSDSYWKSKHLSESAQEICEYYKCKQAYMATQMEDASIALVFKKFNMLDKLIVLRYSVNMDVFMAGQNAQLMWSEGKS